MLIDRRYFENWGAMATSKSEMAELVTQLVMNTLPNDGSRYDIPIGSSTFCRGWDGYVDSVSAHHFIPEGKSGWEFGAVTNVLKKANKDYDTRIKASASSLEDALNAFSPGFPSTMERIS